MRETADWREMEDRFNRIHGAPAAKIAMEQALFEAIRQFVQKERLENTAPRIEKYRRYFEAVRYWLPRTAETMGETAAELETKGRIRADAKKGAE